jgi:SAM-dependent methyltransferase
MDEYLRANQARWDELVPIHLRSAFYDVEGFKAGRLSLSSIEREELGDVSGRSLLHLQCHFGLDTISWARLGARVVGVDFSQAAIDAARALAVETGVEAEFIQADIANLPASLDDRFDIVFTSYGIICWLPDLGEWATAAARCLVPGGVFYIADFHPFACVFDDQSSDLQLRYPYLASGEPLVFEGNEGSYADASVRLETSVNYAWSHSLSEVVNALIAAGLSIDFLHEFDFSPEAFRPNLERGDDGRFRLKDHGESVPLVFSIKATKR